MSAIKALNTSHIAISLAAKVAAERILRPKAVSTDDVPFELGAITATWLESVMCSGVAGASINNIVRGGRSSGTSERAQFSLEYNELGLGAGLPSSIFVKAAPGVLTRMANGLTGTMASEGSFYRYMRPDLGEIVEAPIGYHSAWDFSNFRSVHVLEDLVATKSATFCDPTTIISKAQACCAVQMMAGYHAKYYDRPQIARDFPWLRSYPQWWLDSMKHFDIKAAAMKGVKKAEHFLPREISGNQRKLWQGFIESVDVHNHLPATLLHGDVHLGNWYITGDGRMGLCDWQCVSKGHWSRDLAYAISSMLPVECRRQWESELLSLYAETLVKNGGPTIPFKEVFSHYRMQLFSAFMMWAPTYHHPRFLPDMQPQDVAEEVLKRIGTALADHDCMSRINN
jgi:hypothetical protein